MGEAAKQRQPAKQSRAQPRCAQVRIQIFEFKFISPTFSRREREGAEIGAARLSSFARRRRGLGSLAVRSFSLSLSLLLLPLLLLPPPRDWWRRVRPHLAWREGRGRESRMSKWARRGTPPSDYGVLEPTLEALEGEVRARLGEKKQGLSRHESAWPVVQLNWQRTRYVHDMFYKFGRISQECFDYCARNKIIDKPLSDKWLEPGYEKLCSLHAIDPANHAFGTVSVCRVPKKDLAPGTLVINNFSGCRGCASGAQGESNIFGNRYGQRLAALQIRREELLEQERLKEEEAEREAEAAAAAAKAEKEERKRKRKEEKAADGDDDGDKAEKKKKKKHKKDKSSSKGGDGDGDGAGDERVWAASKEEEAEADLVEERAVAEGEA